jgi:hypothetical protein
MTNDAPQSVYDELAEIMERMGKIQKKLRNVRERLDRMKPIQRVTRKVREDAMKHFHTTTPWVDCIFSEGFSFEDYVRRIDWSRFSEQERKEITSKKFEKKIYEDYKMFKNKRVEERRRELNESRRKLEREIEILGETEDNVRLTFGMELCT